MNRETLVERNRKLAEAFHQPSVRERLRRALLVDLARVPVPVIEKPKNCILLIRPDHLGDVLLTTPAIREVRAARPDAEIHALVGPWSADVLSAYDEIDRVLTLPFPGFQRGLRTSWHSPYALLWRSARQIRQIGYREAVIFRPDHWWGAMLTKYAGIPKRVGYDLPDVGRFLTTRVRHRHEHAVVQNLRLVEALTGTAVSDRTPLRFPVDDHDRQYVNAYLEEWGIDVTRPIIVIHAGSGTWAKQWLEERWATVADALAGQYNAAAVFTGSDHELAMVWQIVQGMREPTCLMLGETRVPQLAALLERAVLVLGPDSGPMHLAAAVGTPTVTLFGPADPVEFGPWGPDDRHAVLASSIGCRPCRVLDWNGDAPENHPCMRDITTAQVLDTARRLVAGQERRQ